MTHRLFFLRVLRSALNPATLVTAGAPWLIAVAQAFYVANKAGGYADLINQPRVCGLLEHRTQLYTLIVAYFFYLFIVIRICVASGKTTSGSWNYYRLETHKHIVVILIAFLATSIYTGWFILGGHVMTRSLIDIYANLESCREGTITATEFPPLSSPITWLRIFVGLFAVWTEYLNRQQHAKG